MSDGRSADPAEEPLALSYRQDPYRVPLFEEKQERQHKHRSEGIPERDISSLRAFGPRGRQVLRLVRVTARAFLFFHVCVFCF